MYIKRRKNISFITSRFRTKLVKGQSYNSSAFSQSRQENEIKDKVALNGTNMHIKDFSIYDILNCL